jgi:uncharacterized protein YndB with AHSA1/START domain
VAAKSNSSLGAPPERGLVITRIFDARRELVWKAWAEPEHLMCWRRPKNFTSPFCKADFRVGGVYLFCVRSPEGYDFWSAGVYREIVEPERIVYTHSFADEKGNPVPASHYKMPGDWPAETLVTVMFEEHQGKTKLSLRQIGIPSGVMGELAAAGWNESLDKLTESLEKAEGQI